MTPSEFKAWFDGFTEALEDRPSKDQWTRIKARVAEIDGRAVTEHIYVHRYLPHYYQTYYGTPYYGGAITLCGNGIASSTSGNLNAGAGNLQSAGMNLAVSGSFDSHAAMLSLGRAEAAGLN